VALTTTLIDCWFDTVLPDHGEAFTDRATIDELLDAARRQQAR
jgi:hypothetical protein